MKMVEICCLANSRKLGGRCVAGVHLPTGRWLRPVSRNTNRELEPRHYQLPLPWRETQVLDTIHLGLDARCPGCHHPEDWEMANVRWRLVQRPASVAELRQLRELLLPALYQENLLFGSADDHVPYAVLKAAPAPASLALIHPSRISWYIEAREEKRRYRACFTYHGIYYDIGLTDQVWEQRLEKLSPGNYSPGAAGLAVGSEIWLTVSLGDRLRVIVSSWQPR